MPAASFSQRHEHEAGRDGRHDNAKRYLSSAFLPTLVDLSLTLALGRLPPSLSPGVLWYPTRLALTLLLFAPRCLTAAEAGCFAAHGINDATRPHSSYRYRHAPCHSRARTDGKRRSRAVTHGHRERPPTWARAG